MISRMVYMDGATFQVKLAIIIIVIIQQNHI